MSQHVLTVNLRDDPAAIATYREYHTRVWPEVVERLREVGVRRMAIHLLGRRLVMIVEVDDGLDVRRVFEAHRRATGRVEEWERLMKALQEPVADAPPGEWWAVMEPVFHLS
jgi:L-rhamnose mutarotase